MSLGRREAVVYSLATVSNVTSIDEIAVALRVKPEKALKIVQNMIEASTKDMVKELILFKNAQIDHRSKRIILDPNSAYIVTTSDAVVRRNAGLGRMASIAGYFGGISSLILALSALAAGSWGGLILCLIVFAAFVLLIRKGSQMKRRVMRFERYVSLLSAQKMPSLKDIAASTSKSMDFVSNDLKKMVQLKFFANASISSATNEVIIGNRTVSEYSTPVAVLKEAPSAAQVEDEMETFICPGCGASGTKQKGVPTHCEYCESVIK